MEKEQIPYQRKSYLAIGEMYFWTVTIHQWKCLLVKEEYRKIVVDSLNYLTSKGKIDVFAFVIMPNHIHLIWRINEMNGKETTPGAFLKYTAHEFKKLLRKEPPERLEEYKVLVNNKEFEFWQRDPLAIHLYTKKVAYQKLDYLHNSPLADHWRLVKDPNDYEYSTCSYYERNEVKYPFVKDLRDEF